MNALLLALPLLVQDAPQQTVPERAAELAQTLIDAEFTSGMVIGTLTEEGKWTQGFGTLGPDTDAVPDAKTLYEIGSISKVFTGILLADAVQRGLVELEVGGERLGRARSRPTRARR